MALDGLDPWAGLKILVSAVTSIQETLTAGCLSGQRMPPRPLGGRRLPSRFRQRAICYRVSTGELLPTPHSRSQGRWRQARVFTTPRCSALDDMEASYRLNAQR